MKLNSIVLLSEQPIAANRAEHGFANMKNSSGDSGTVTGCCMLTCLTRYHVRDVVQPPVFVTAALKRKEKKLASTWSRGGPSLAQVYNPAKHKICTSPITRNVGPRS